MVVLIKERGSRTVIPNNTLRGTFLELRRLELFGGAVHVTDGLVLYRKAAREALVGLAATVKLPSVVQVCDLVSQAGAAHHPVEIPRAVEFLRRVRLGHRRFLPDRRDGRHRQAESGAAAAAPGRGETHTKGWGESFW